MAPFWLNFFTQWPFKMHTFGQKQKVFWQSHIGGILNNLILLDTILYIPDTAEMRLKTRKIRNPKHPSQNLFILQHTQKIWTYSNHFIHQKSVVFRHVMQFLHIVQKSIPIHVLTFQGLASQGISSFCRFTVSYYSPLPKLILWKWILIYLILNEIEGNRLSYVLFSFP